MPSSNALVLKSKAARTHAARNRLIGKRPKQRARTDGRWWQNTNLMNWYQDRRMRREAENRKRRQKRQLDMIAWGPENDY